ncbi:thioredoxin [Jiangella sp. DSM 45060]|uniref:thioredoxin n=1 Tax=Jiangella sp. DSM 45060 TaxID=1798224 RepID=UPI00087AED94|nr:thioredoxin [Jiangella sp. DSM 45060]SDT59240.1 thioredoxin [Jiangella sp. DSM 45060]
MTLTVTTETFDHEVLRSDLPVLVDFWAEWCPPCHMIAPMLDQLAGELDGTIAIRKINNDENPEVGARYRVMSLPTLMLFVDGEPVQALVGARPKARLLKELDDALSR